jgi:hypothetical protein
MGWQYAEVPKVFMGVDQQSQSYEIDVSKQIDLDLWVNF